ncbi:MAG: DUF2254 domain-containing protein [Polyangiaceae bacterium]|nr:DUF2254 domain-containing protein [Polyangiaceae bacterium]
MTSPSAAQWRRQWLAPMALLTTLALAVFAALYSADYAFSPAPAGPRAGPLDRYFAFSADLISDAASALGAMIAAVLGIVVTVVSIVVQLSAARYPKVATMFFRDRTNRAVISFYVAACVCGVWLSFGLHPDFVPRLTLLATLGLTTSGLAMMGPYFAYVFRFLEPANIVERVRHNAVRTAARGARDAGLADAMQLATLVSLEELTDVASHCINGRDKLTATSAVDALRDFALAYLPLKGGALPEWFRLGPDLRKNPDFVAMDPESLDDLETRRTWVEWKVMRQYLGIYNEAAAGGMRDISYLVAIDTRYLGEAAAARGDTELVALVLRYMNSYLRSTLNARDVRTAYNVLNQYRLLVESLLRSGLNDIAVEAVGHMKYYGHVSLDLKLSFVAETVAYDVCALCMLAHELGCPREPDLLRAFLDLDRDSTERGQEQGLKGVRKAQVKLAAYYLSAGEDERAEHIRRDMEAESRERLQAIRYELERVTSKDFWEIIDRGRNLDYLPPGQRDAMRRFFESLGVTGSPPRPLHASPPPSSDDRH